MTSSSELPLGSALPSFELPGVDGRTWRDTDFREPVVVLVVTCNHCPVSVAYEDRLIALAKAYEGRAAIVAINPNAQSEGSAEPSRHHRVASAARTPPAEATTHPGDSFDAMRVRAKEKGFPFPYLRDESQALARALHAKCTPDPFVFDANRRLVYAGRIDDAQRGTPTSHDLARAIDAALVGRAIDFEVRPAMGCSIKWKS